LPFVVQHRDNCLTINGLDNEARRIKVGNLVSVARKRAASYSGVGIERRPGPRRWANLLFLVPLVFIIIYGYGMDESFAEIWIYFLPIPLFLFQLICPTVVGWLFSICT
jgi:hypothetical protein